MKKLVYIFCIVLFLTSCTEEFLDGLLGVENEPVVIEGYFYKNCDGEPYANFPLRVEQVNRPNFGGIENITIGHVVTDSKGYIRFEKESDKPIPEINFITNNGNIFYRSGSTSKKLILFNAVGSAKVKHNLILKVDNPLTKFDTLFVNATANVPFLALPGPFENNQVVEVEISPNIVFANLVSLPYESKINIVYAIGSEEFHEFRTNNSPTNPKNLIFNVPQEACGLGGDVVIDLTGYPK